MNKFKKANAVYAALALLCALTAVSCADEAKTPVETGTQSPAEQTTSADTAIDFSSMSFLEKMQYSNAQLDDKLPEKDYGGETFTVWIRASDTEHVMATEENGEIFNDASYGQKRTIEERFGLNLNYFNYGGDWTESMKRFNTSLMSGDYFADLVENWNATTPSSIAQGFYLDISGQSAIDTSMPWYFADEMETAAYLGKQYSAVGFMNPKTVFNEITCIFFNKDLANNYDIEDLYQVVRDGRWTLDYAMDICKDFYYDLNGDNAYDLGDLYGFVSDPLNCWYHGFAELGIPLLSLDDDGSYSISLFDQPEKCQVILDKLREFQNLDSNMYNVKKHGMIYDEMFGLGNSLIAISSLKNLDRLDNVSFSYGVLPRFKADEAQEHYYTTALNNPWSVPVSTKSLERSAILMTAFAAEGYKQVVPVLYEQSIKTKNVVDEESGEMIDLMLQNFRGEPLFYYTDMNKFAHHTLMEQYLTSKKGYGSFTASIEKKMRTTIEKILEAYAELERNQ